MIKERADILTRNLEVGKKYIIKYIAGKRNKQGTNRFEATILCI